VYRPPHFDYLPPEIQIHLICIQLIGFVKCIEYTRFYLRSFGQSITRDANVQYYLFLTALHNIKAYGRMEIWLHALLFLVLDTVRHKNSGLKAGFKTRASFFWNVTQCRWVVLTFRDNI